MTAHEWHYCPVWIADRPCAMRRLHAGSHLPMIAPRPLSTWDEPALAESMSRHPAGKANR